MRTPPALFVAVVLVTLPVAGCDDHPPAPPPAVSAAAAAPSASVALVASASASAPAASASAAPAEPEREIAGAAQILVTWKGAELAPKSVTRSKEDAKKRAEEALQKLKKDPAAFEATVKTYSDDEGSKKVAGALGNFERNAMPEAFSKATFSMKVGDTSDVVETPRGFHIIKRTR